MGKSKYFLLAITLIIIGITGLLNAQETPSNTPIKTELNPPEELTVSDTPDDSNGNISFSWKKMPYENNNLFYVIYISKSPDVPLDITATCFASIQNWKTDKDKEPTDVNRFFVVHFAENFRQPVQQARKQAKSRPTEHHIMKMPYDKIGIV